MLPPTYNIEVEMPSGRRVGLGATNVPSILGLQLFQRNSQRATSVAPDEARLLISPSLPRSQAIFVSNPDGSFVCAAPAGFMEEEWASIQPLRNEEVVVPATRRLRDLARSLRQAVQWDVGNDMLRRAARRRLLLSQILAADLIVNLLLSASFVLRATYFVVPSGPPRFLVGSWLIFSILFSFLGRRILHSARDRVYSFLSSAAYISVCGQLGMAIFVTHWASHDGGKIKSVGPLAILMNLPLRLLIGAQAGWLYDELKYLLSLPPDIDLA